ncbi:little elongation complex subunit 2 isoform X2 [Eucyclogobius newberryi]|uniref:little elongation complex subunit 2 isoform X2 n=1 Tax=Eucyclogobius newberryi TaxID=166745 RepID=UPI003B5AFB82
MEIVWKDPPIPQEGPVFNKDLYDKIGFGPTIQELWNLLQSPQDNNPSTEHNIVQNGGPPTEKQNESLREDSIWISSDSEVVDMQTEDPKATTEPCVKKSKCKLQFPEPRVPYPCLSVLSKTEQRKYLNFLASSKKEKPLSQIILNKVSNEVMHFMKYLQDVSRLCAEDYNVISPAALQYSEEVYRSSLEYINALHPLYLIHELTSLTGGKFNPALALNFEKELLHMGSVDVAQTKPVNVGVQLALEYQTVSSHTPPAKKAKELHASISGDSNAARLCSIYEPHVCLTPEALVQLLNNHGPDFREEWEIPVLIKAYPSKDKNMKKTVFIDSPLMKSTVTMRERSHIYHEESLKLGISKSGTKKVIDVMTQLPVREQPAFGRNVATLNNDNLDFEVDLIDLETFGESSSSKTPKVKRTKTEEGASGKSENITCRTRSSDKKESRGLNEEMDRALPISPKAKASQSKHCDQKSDRSDPLDSDDDNLIINDVSPIRPKRSQSSDSELGSPVSRSNKKRKPRPPGDQLGEILQMQTAMFNSNPSDVAKCSSSAQDTGLPSKQSGPALHSTPLVKACVSSYLERNPDQKEDPGDSLHSAAAPKPAELKKILSHELQKAAEDERDYESPEEGNVCYKLYSLSELLLMVRASISLCHTQKLSNHNQWVPLNILPKLEYQLTYGVECLSNTEACQLWTESLLHSSTESFIAHIDALTSRLALLRKLPDNWIHNVSCGFKPSKSLNILHHLLQKLIGLDEGQYLLRHKVGEPFVNILKAAHGNGRPGVYNLQQIHSDIPQPPDSASAPWIPLDPSVCMPFHRQNVRVPCTFPPPEFTPAQTGGTAHPHSNKGGQPGGKRPKKNTKKKFAAKFKK